MTCATSTPRRSRSARRCARRRDRGPRAPMRTRARTSTPTHAHLRMRSRARTHTDIHTYARTHAHTHTRARARAPHARAAQVDTNRRDADVPPRFYVDVSHYTPAARYKALELHLETDFERALAAGLLPFTVAAETAEDSLEWRVAAGDVDVGEELPRLLRGVRAAARPAAFAAFAGALAVLEACRREPRRRRVAAMLAAGHAAGKVRTCARACAWCVRRASAWRECTLTHTHTHHRGGAGGAICVGRARSARLPLSKGQRRHDGAAARARDVRARRGRAARAAAQAPAALAAAPRGRPKHRRGGLCGPQGET